MSALLEERLAEAHREIERLRAALATAELSEWANRNTAIAIYNAAIEQCARVAEEQQHWAGLGCSNAFAAAIRALEG